MGLFDSVRGMLRARGATEQAASLDTVEQIGAAEQAEAFMEQQLAGADVDANDPDFAPVDGVDVDQYARICKEIADGGPQQTMEVVNGIISAHGVDPTKWQHIAEVWNERVMRSMPVKMRYSRTFLGQ